VRLTAAFFCLALVLGATEPGAAETTLAWKVAPQDFVHYRATTYEVTDSQAMPGVKRGSSTDLHGFHGYELVEGVRVARPLTQEGWLRVPFLYRLPRPRLVADAHVDIDETVPGTWQIGPVHARGQLRVLELRKGAGGMELRLRGVVMFSPPAEAQTSHPYRALARGRLDWSATFDVERGVMTHIEYDLDALSGRAGAPAPRAVSALGPEDRSLRVKAVLELDRVYPRRYEGFTLDVDRALVRACDYLETLQQDDGSFHATAPWGTTGLALLALLRSGRSATGTVVTKGFRYLLAHEPRGTYETAMVIMAFEALGTPPEELLSARRGELAPPLPRTLAPEAAKYVQRCADYLLGAVQTAKPEGKTVTGRTELLRWGYPFDYELNLEPDEKDWWDNSNTQYAVLGLNSAARCGVAIPAAIWAGVAEHFLAVQSPTGPERDDLRLTPHERRGRDPSARRYAPKPLKSRERGWSYQTCSAPEHAYGSMTSAGIASLAIAAAHLAGPKGARRHKALLRRIEDGIRDGWAALLGMWLACENPHYTGWHLYHLYGLERAGILTDVELVQDHDWYWEGANQLLLRQQEDGSWPLQGSPPHDTLWGILFLSRSTTPITPR